MERALTYMASSQHADDRDPPGQIFIGSCTNSRIEDLRAAAAIVRGRRVASSVKLAMVVPGSGLVKAQAEKEGLDRVFRDAGFEWRDPRLLDVPRDERRPPRGRRAFGVDVEPEFRRQAGHGRAHAPGEPGDGGGGGDRRPFRRRASVEIGGPMEKFTVVNGLVAPMDRADVDTDVIIPKQFLKSIKRTGFGPNLFDAWRYLDEGWPGKPQSERRPNPDFRAQPAALTRAASILVARKNFGCGSSREHATLGARRVRISRGHRTLLRRHLLRNCCKNGLLPVVLAEREVDWLLHEVAAFPGSG